MQDPFSSRCAPAHVVTRFVVYASCVHALAPMQSGAPLCALSAFTACALLTYLCPSCCSPRSQLQSLGWQIFFACMMAVLTSDTLRSAQAALRWGSRCCTVHGLTAWALQAKL